MRNHIEYKLAAWSSILLLLYSFATILIVAFIGGPPESVSECFRIISENRLYGLLRLDILTVFIMPLYYVLFYAFYKSLKEASPGLAALSFLFVCAGVTLFLAAPSVYSFARLSDGYQMAAGDEEKLVFRSAAEALFATDIWNGTGPKLGGILVQTAAVTFSVLMLHSRNFSRATAYTGILTHGLDLIHILVAFFSIPVANSIMAVAGVLYLLWFVLIFTSLKRMSGTGEFQSVSI